MIDTYKSFDFIERINQSQSGEEISSITQDYFQEKGFPLVCYALFKNGVCIDPLFLTNYPGEWGDHYHENVYKDKDIVLGITDETTLPFSWDSLKNRSEYGLEQKKIFDEATEFGLRSGVTIPVHGPKNIKGVISIANGMQADEFAKFEVGIHRQLHLIAAYAHQKIVDLLLPQNETFAKLLTRREKEVLTWSARGKTAWDISTILMISEATAREHIYNACRKMGVHSKTHAISMAIIQGIISP